MNKSIVIICAAVLTIIGLVIALFAVSSSKKVPDVWLPPVCDNSCQIFHSMLEELSPLKCDSFEGVEHTLCQIKNHIHYRDNLVFNYGLSDIERESDIIDHKKCENNLPINFETCLNDNIKREDIEKALFEYMKNVEPSLMSNEDDADIFSDALNDEYIQTAVKRIQKFIEYVEMRERLADVNDAAFIDFYKSHKQEFDEKNFVNPESSRDEYKRLRESRVQAEFGVSEDKLYGDLEKIEDKEILRSTLPKFANTLSVRYTYDILRLRYIGEKINTEHLERIEHFFESYTTYNLHKPHYKINYPERVFRTCNRPVSNIYQVEYEAIREHLPEFGGLIIPWILMYTLFENNVPDSNMQLYKKLDYLGASSISDGDATDDEKELFNNFKTYMNNHKLTSSRTSQSYKLIFHDIGACEAGGTGTSLYGYIVDPNCQYINISSNKSTLSITLIGADGKLGTSDDLEMDFSINDIESYINDFKTESTAQKSPKPSMGSTNKEQPSHNAIPPKAETQTTRKKSDETPSEEVSTWDRYGIQFVRHITYPKKTTPSWIILKDSQNRFCAIITESKYPILQENNYCIPFSGNDADLKDSFAGNRIAEIDFPDHKKCKKIGIQSSNDYCNRFNQAFENMAEKEKFFDAASVCRLDPNLDDDFTKKVCNLLISKDEVL